MDVAYENDPHSRTVMLCAVTGGVLALGPLALFLVMPSIEIPAGGFPGGEGFAATTTTWELIRNELALYGNHAAMFDTGRLAGEGFGNKSMFESLAPEAVYAQASHVRVFLELDPDDISSFFVVTAFPANAPPERRKG